MKQLNDKIITWLKHHNIDKLSPDKQYLKIIEEVGELASGLLKNDLEAIKDAIGDIYVAVVGLGLQYKVPKKIIDEINHYELSSVYWVEKEGEVLELLLKRVSGLYIKINDLSDISFVLSQLQRIALYKRLTLKECVEHAYNEIKDREIKIENGVAVK